jgi:glutaredoxin-like YruB-family protein
VTQSIKVYSTSTCPWCKRLKQFLDEKNISYRNFDVGTDKEAREEMITKTGQLAVPTIDLEGEIKVGYDENWLKEKLNIH